MKAKCLGSRPTLAALYLWLTWALSALILSTAGIAPAAAAGYIRPGITEQVDLRSDGTRPSPSSCSSGDPAGYCLATSSVSADGRFVAFQSWADDLAPNDAEAFSDIFVRDRRTGETTLVTEGYGGLPPLGIPSGIGLRRLSFDPNISGNGRFVVFNSDATNLVMGDTNLIADTFVRDLRTGEIERVSVTSDGSQALGVPLQSRGSRGTSISANGRFVVFTTDAINLTPEVEPPAGCTGGDEYGCGSVYLHDRKTGETKLVSEDPANYEEPVTAWQPSISGNGRFVAFTSHSTIDGDPFLRSRSEVYVRDLRTWALEKASVTSHGDQSDGGSWTGRLGNSISSNGRFVMFGSFGRLVPNPGRLNDSGLYVHDRKTGETRQVSVNSYGEPSRTPWSGELHAISDNGRFAVWADASENLAEDDAGSEGFQNTCLGVRSCDYDIFVYDLKWWSTEMVSRATNGQEAADPGDFQGVSQFAPSISASGRYVTFWSHAPNLGKGTDDDDAPNIFIRDRGLDDVGVGGIDVVDAAGSRSALADDGMVDFRDPRGDAAVGAMRNADLVNVRVIRRPGLDDLFVVLEMDDLRWSRVRTEQASVAYQLDFRANGTPYRVVARSLAFGPSAVDPQLAICRVTCSWVATLRGNQGSTADNVVFSIPLRRIGLDDGGELSDLAVTTRPIVSLEQRLVVLDSLDGSPARMSDPVEGIKELARRGVAGVARPTRRG